MSWRRDHCRLRCLPEWHVNRIDLGEVVSKGLQHASLGFCLLFQVIKILRQQIAYTMSWHEFARQYTFGGEHIQQHLHAMLELLCPSKSLPHSALDPTRHVAWRPW